MKVRHKYYGDTGVVEGEASDGRMLVRWDRPGSLCNYRQYAFNLVFIVPCGKAPPQTAPSSAYDHAARLYRVLCEKHWPGMPECNMKPLPTIAGVIDQIDHITAHLTLPAP